MRRVPLWLTGLIPVLALAACGTGWGLPAGTASPAGQTGRGGAGRAVHVSPGWRIVQALPSEPGSGQPGGGSNDMLSVAAVGARDAWAVGYVCPQQCGPSSDSTLAEHWAGARHQPGRPRRHLDVRDRSATPSGVPPFTYLYHYSNGQWSRQPAPALGGQATEMGVLSWRPGASSGWAAADTGNRGVLLRYFPSPIGH
jgi:hypothetical protein